MNVLAVGCHPDDIEISCSGTLAKCVKRGDKVTVCHVTNGNMGHEIISAEELREIRINEAKKAGSLAGMNFSPTEWVDITDEIDLKIEMLECHESQLKWMRDHDNIDFAEFVRSCSRFRGIQSGVQYAEAFCQELVWPKVVTRRLLP
ncbi:MAG: PIG-L family deacetylase [Clostridia bacterium]|nr:PIG-L family deacetylase [Clostridia bacterium]